MATIPQVRQAVHTMLVTHAQQADDALHDTKRPDTAVLTGPLLTQALVLGWLAHPDATVEQLAQSAARVGAPVSPQAIDQRFTLETAHLLKTVRQASVQERIAADPVAMPILQRCRGVRVRDSTTLTLPDALAAHGQGAVAAAAPSAPARPSRAACSSTC